MESHHLSSDALDLFDVQYVIPTKRLDLGLDLSFIDCKIYTMHAQPIPPDPILFLDIGSGTQDCLYYSPGTSLQNCPQCILPSPARMMNQKITTYTKTKTNLFLHGSTMGGGFASAAYFHIKTGLKLAATPEAALSLHDNLDRVTQKGIVLCDDPPPGHTPLFIADYDPDFWRSFFHLTGLVHPKQIICAVQDHGFDPKASNRRKRFQNWEQFLQSQSGNPFLLLHETPPQDLTRMRSLQKQTGGPVADTGAAAMLGLLSSPEIQHQAGDKGMLLINIGNSHVLAFLVFQERVYGVYEQHTSSISPDKLWADLQSFKLGRLTHNTVFDQGGHGCVVTTLPEEAKGFPTAFCIGPRSDILKEYDLHFPAPHGNMMLAGCFGLLYAFCKNHSYQNPFQELF